MTTYTKFLTPSVADASGQIEGIGNQPKFTVQDSHGTDLVEHSLVWVKFTIMPAQSPSSALG